MERYFVNSSFCAYEIKQIEDLVAGGYAKNKSDFVRNAAIAYIDKCYGSS